ncbi:hypothetical protein [Tsukamurella soli]
MDGAETIVERVLIESVEGCGIRHWARIDDVSAHHPGFEPLDVHPDLADELIQTALFGGVIHLASTARSRGLFIEARE